MREPVSEGAHYLTGIGRGEGRVLLVEGGHWEESGPVQIVLGGGRPLGARLAGWLGIVGVMAVLGTGLVATLAWAEPSAPRCSLAWPEIAQNFGPETGWRLAAPPVPFSLADGDVPQYQAHVFESGQDSGMALIIAEWGDPESPRLGSVVYCTVHSAEGSVLEELGRNPLKVTTVPTACRECA